MPRSKSRSERVENGKKNHHRRHNSSVFARTLSASIFCRGDSIGGQIDPKALIKSNDKNSLPDNRIEDDVVTMQQRLMDSDEELRVMKEKLEAAELDKEDGMKELKEKLDADKENAVKELKEKLGAVEVEQENSVKMLKEKLYAAELDKDNAVQELKEKLIAAELEKKNAIKELKDKLDSAEVEKENAVKELEDVKGLTEETSSRKVKELTYEIEVLKTKLSKRDKTIKSLEMELGESQELEAVLVEKDGLIDRLNKELRDLRDREKKSLSIVSEYMKKNEEIEAEVKRLRESDSKSKEALAAKMKEYESIEFELAETRIERTKLRKKVESLQSMHNQTSGSSDDIELKSSWEAERIEALEDELELLKEEWRNALEGEQRSAKAMEDLALALAEVAAEAKEAKEDLQYRVVELKQAHEQIERLQKMLKEIRNEAEVYRNAVSRLRLESEEMLMAWTGKEKGFINCIKRAEEEKAAAVEESRRLTESLRAAENMIWSAREETHKSRDLLKQAVNEANVAKASARLAQDESSALTDALAEKEDILCSLSEELEILRIREESDKERIRKLRRQLSKSSSSSEIKIDIRELHDSDRESELEEKDKDRDKDKETDENTEDDYTGMTLNLEELKLMTDPEPDDLHIGILDEDPAKEEALKGSIFDTSAVTPKSEPHTPRSGHKQRRRRYSFSYTEVKEETNSEAYYHSEFDHAESTTTTTTTKHRRVKTMFRRVGALGGLFVIKRGSSSNQKDATPALPSPTPVPALPSPPDVTSPPASQSSAE